MKILGIRTKWTIRYSKCIKISSSSAVSATSRIGKLRRSLPVFIAAWLRLPNSRTHMLLNYLKENGFKGELVDFA
jgi:hypothetical protein